MAPADYPSLVITYRDSQGSTSTRTVRDVVLVDSAHIDAHCSLRDARRTFAIRRIESAVDAQTGEVVDVSAWLGCPMPEAPPAPPVSQSRSGQRRTFQQRYRLAVIYDHFHARLLESFEHRCFRCGSTNDLVLDHHVPYALGGRLEPGNIIVLCADCNERKGDRPPTEAYSANQLSAATRILDEQPALLAFEFDNAAWDRDRAGYLRSLGIDAGTVERVLTDPDHVHFIGPASEPIGVRIRVD